MALNRAIYRENRIKDGVKYAIEVYAVPGGIYAKFTCPVCNETIVTGGSDPTDTEALRAILISVDAHHSAKHTPAA